MKSPDISYRSVAEIKKFQELKLVELVAYLQQNSSFYKRLFLDSGFSAASIQTFEDLVLLPVTTKEDLQQHNYDFLCADLAKVIDYSSTSGTLGSPVSIMLTDNDLNRLAYNEYCSFVCTGANEKDIFQLMLTLDRQFMAGMAYYTGLRKLGAGIIRLGPGVPSLQWETILRIQPTAIVAVPSFILKLIEYAQIHAIDINSTSVKKAICIGENIRNPDFELNILGKKITDSWNIELYSTYASTEMQTAFTECEQGKGGHLNPELLIVEIVNENNQPVKSGEAGEVTITTLGVEGMPLLRYKTGDVCFFVDEPCRCGRNTLRLSPLIGRKKQMIKYKGTTLYPPALFDLLNEMEEITDFVAEVYSNDIGMDEVLLHLQARNFSEETDRKIRAYLQARLRVSPHIRYAGAEEIRFLQFGETGRKAMKFIDKRK